jgi:hypothetical protein
MSNFDQTPLSKERMFWVLGPVRAALPIPRHPQPLEQKSLQAEPVAEPRERRLPGVLFLWRLSVKSQLLRKRCRPGAVANSTRSISVASSASAFELLTRFETGQRFTPQVTLRGLGSD